MREFKVGDKTYRAISADDVFQKTRLSRAHPPSYVVPGSSAGEWVLYWHCGARYMVDVTQTRPHSPIDRLRFRLQRAWARVAGRRWQRGREYTTCKDCWFFSRRELDTFVLLLASWSNEKLADFMFDWMTLVNQRDVLLGDHDFVLPIPDWPFGLAKALGGFRYFGRKDGDLYLTETHPELVDPTAD